MIFANTLLRWLMPELRRPAASAELVVDSDMAITARMMIRFIFRTPYRMVWDGPVPNLVSTKEIRVENLEF